MLAWYMNDGLYRTHAWEGLPRGSPVMCTCMSTNPGMMTHPEASRTLRFADTRFNAAASEVLSRPTTFNDLASVSCQACHAMYISHLRDADA